MYPQYHTSTPWERTFHSMSIAMVNGMPMNGVKSDKNIMRGENSYGNYKE